MTYQNQIEIVLFTNTRKKNPKAPDSSGSVEFPDGTKYDVALWNRVSKNGTPFQSGQLKIAQDRGSSGGTGGGQVNVDF